MLNWIVNAFCSANVMQCKIICAIFWPKYKLLETWIGHWFILQFSKDFSRSAKKNLLTSSSRYLSIEPRRHNNRSLTLTQLCDKVLTLRQFLMWQLQIIIDMLLIWNLNTLVAQRFVSIFNIYSILHTWNTFLQITRQYLGQWQL